jgi:hypothetical protein
MTCVEGFRGNYVLWEEVGFCMQDEYTEDSYQRVGWFGFFLL